VRLGELPSGHAVILAEIVDMGHAQRATAVKHGALTGGLPFVRLGNGPRSLVIFPGLADAAWDVTRRARILASHYQRFADKFTVHVISRKRGLPRGYTTRGMAADYARAFECDIGPAAVMGISLGGYIAQTFAAGYPKYVERLVIACAANRVSDKGREIPERWLALARENRWREFYWDIAKVTAEEFHQTFYQYIIPLLRLRPTEARDFLVSLEACLTHDSTELLEKIQAPTLVIGGSTDIFFPPRYLRDMAQHIHNASLRFIEGCGHGADELRKDEFDDAVLEFLRGRDSAVDTVKVQGGGLPVRVSALKRIWPKGFPSFK
jgi:pimeloyl-ACP methyl ester carboxylesterase